ncbi:hypothetical protein Ga0100231_024790 [Opitutaceae bacterium TAV4]|nr:hypothetical protein Ga0100231_024790 [Opitutaceae bacterium TAV4]
MKIICQSPALPTPGLRRVLDLMLRKRIYLAQFRRLGEAPARPGDLGKIGRIWRNTGTGQLLAALLQEGFAETADLGGDSQQSRYQLTKRGRRLLALLIDLE